MLIARKAHRALEPVHAMIYFAPEATERFEALGLRRARLAYLASRSAPMGAVGPGVVTATFFNFSPAVVAEEIPKAWAIASPESVVAARFEAAGAALERLLGADAVRSAAVTEAAELAEEATRGCGAEARPLYAGHADQRWPSAPHVRLWHAVSLLREYRGDGHVWALARAGLSGLQALVLRCTSGEGPNERFLKRSRGWSDDEWDTARATLRDRGLLNEAGELTDAATTLLEELEVETDALAAAPWRYLGTERTERLIELGSELAHSLVHAGAFPREIFGR